jgi:transcriptional regulator with GAF, ATPase, and Fis domain
MAIDLIKRGKSTKEVAEGQDIVQIAQFLRRKSGEAFPVEITVTIHKKKGEVVSVTGIVRDITERNRANLELKQAYDEIRQLKDRLEAENLTLRQEVKISFKDNELIGKSHAFRTVLQQAEHVAPTDSTVLILGETGTGKGLIARKIHQLSGRKDRLMVNVNCAALPATLIESEFFGHERGAFTGATDRKIGRFEMADGGTIFLDEIGDLPIELQAKLLRILQDQEFERLGSSTTRTVDTRIIAATNRDLDSLIEQGAFRTDLYYRLGVFPIRIPPLQSRMKKLGIQRPSP